eukprot:325579-Prorocentrum_minimum.AAC.1
MGVRRGSGGGQEGVQMGVRRGSGGDVSSRRARNPNACYGVRGVMGFRNGRYNYELSPTFREQLPF